MNHWRRYLAPVAVVCLLPGTGYATQYLTLSEAQKVCFPSADKFESSHVMFNAAQITSIEKNSGQKVRTKGQQIWKAIKDDKLIGYFIVDYVIGKHLVIDYAVALNIDGSINNVEILEYRESYGGEIRNPDWLKQFKGKTKSSELTIHEDINNISGATLSSRHVTEGVKRILATFDVIFKP